jgi:diacylglycerol kinase family enzyme
VVVGGGDGTVSAAAGVLAGTGVPLGVLPLGTLNHFAKDLGLPEGISAAAEAVAAAAAGRRRPRAVDVGECNGRVFVNNSLLGAYPYMVADRDRRRKAHGLGKWPAMALAFVRMLWRFPRRRVSLCLEGSATPYRTPALFVGVNRYTMGGMTWRRPQGLDGAELWLLVARHGHWAGFARFAFRTAILGLDPRERDFETYAVAAVEIRTGASRVPVSFDGELERMRGPLRYRVRPGALLVLAPPPGPPAQDCRG